MRKERHRVVHVCPSFSPLSETFIYNIVNKLSSYGIKSYVITEERVNSNSRPFERLYEVKGKSKHNLKRYWNFLKRIAKGGSINNAKLASTWPKKRKEVKQKIKRVEPSLIHSHFGPSGVLVAPIAKSLNIPLVCSFYGVDISKYIRDSFWVNEYNNLFKIATKIIGISNHVKSKIISIGGNPEKTMRCHLGIDVDRFEYKRADSTCGKNNVKCIHVGRLVEKKAPVKLVESFRIAKSRVQPKVDLSLKIVGNGPLKKQVIKKVKDLKLEEDVTVIGAIEHNKVIKMLHESNIYTQHCVTARDGDQEGQGVSFVEASASGLPIVTTRHNGLPDVVLHNETGYLVEEGDTEAMGEAISYLAERPSKGVELGSSGRQHIEENFDIDKQVKKLSHIYSKTLKEHE